MDWYSGCYGLILNLTSGQKGEGAGRVVGCGFNHPHSLTYWNEKLYLCSSATGDFHQCGFDKRGNFINSDPMRITETHFLRGLHKVDGGWIMGGSSRRHQEKIAETLELYFFEDSSNRVVETQSINRTAEIYDILPWKAEIMEPIIRRHSLG